MTVPTITARELLDMVREGQSIELIDVRTPVEFREIHVTFARNVPLDLLQPEQLANEANQANRTLYFLCRSGSRGKQACEKVMAAGYQKVFNVEGGTQACEQAGVPVVRGKKAISLERQVRIAAGSLVLLGAVLGAFVHLYWIALSAFVGAGLVFAGVTDTCGMAMLLARMPWNQVSESGDAKAGAACGSCADDG